MTLVENTRDHRFRSWTAEKEDLLKQLIEQKKTAAQMGAVLGFTRNSVIGKIHRMKLSIAENQEGWAEHEIEALKTAWATGMSVQEVSDEIYRVCNTIRTKRAIAAKADRLGLTKRIIKKRTIKLKSYYPAEELSPHIENLEPLNIPFMKLESVHCREVTGRGDDGLAVHCGHRRLPEKSFCAQHQKINYYKPEPLKRKF